MLHSEMPPLKNPRRRRGNAAISPSKGAFGWGKRGGRGRGLSGLGEKLYSEKGGQILLLRLLGVRDLRRTEGKKEGDYAYHIVRFNYEGRGKS